MYRDASHLWRSFSHNRTKINIQFLNERNSDDTLPFIIFLTTVSCDCSNRLWRQRLLLSSRSLWRHKQKLFGIVRPLADGKCRTFLRVIEWYGFHRYLCFHCVFCVRVFRWHCFAEAKPPIATVLGSPGSLSLNRMLNTAEIRRCQ